MRSGCKSIFILSFYSNAESSFEGGKVATEILVRGVQVSEKSRKFDSFPSHLDPATNRTPIMFSLLQRRKKVGTDEETAPLLPSSDSSAPAPSLSTAPASVPTSHGSSTSSSKHGTLSPAIRVVTRDVRRLGLQLTRSGDPAAASTTYLPREAHLREAWISYEVILKHPAAEAV